MVDTPIIFMADTPTIFCKNLQELCSSITNWLTDECNKNNGVKKYILVVDSCNHWVSNDIAICVRSPYSKECIILYLSRIEHGNNYIGSYKVDLSGIDMDSFDVCLRKIIFKLADNIELSYQDILKDNKFRFIDV